MGEELEAVLAAVAYVCGREVDTFDAATRLVDIGADSLVRVVVADQVEERLAAAAGGWRIPDAVLGRVATLGELADAVARLRAPAGVTAGAA